MLLDIFLDALRSAVLISGLVVVMMMLIESMNIDSGGDFFRGLRHSRFGQVVISAFLGVIPGCMGGFASVSLYAHGIFSFGALVAMMIATSGDEAFVMLAMMPHKSWWIFLILFVLAVAVGFLTDFLLRKRSLSLGAACPESLPLHAEDRHKAARTRHFGWQRVLMLAGLILFLVALLSGLLEHDEHGEEEVAGGLMSLLLSEEWMYWLFGLLSCIVLGVLLLGSDHFVQEHLWHHIVRRHLPATFGWTFGVLLLLGIGLHYVDLEAWVTENTALMILLATLVGLIPESGPHLVFVTLYAAGVVPLPVLLASCISQDGHASLPLLAHSKRAFVLAKAVNALVALGVGFALWGLGPLEI